MTDQVQNSPFKPVDSDKELKDVMVALLQSPPEIRIEPLVLPLSEAIFLPGEIPFQASVALDQAGKALQARVLASGKFGNKTVQIRLPNGGRSGFYPNFFGTALARTLLKNKSPEAAIAWLEKILSTEEALAYSVTPLWGAPIESSITISDSMDLVPFEAIPESIHKLWLAEFLRHSMRSPIVSGLNYSEPKSALVSRLTVKPFLWREGDPENINTSKTAEDDVILALTALGPRVVIPVAQWFTFQDPDLEDAAVCGRSSRVIEMLPIKPASEELLDSSSVKELLEQMTRLHRSSLDRVRIGLKRLSLAIRRHGKGDSALDLAIALEALLGDGDTSGMTHKTANRASRFLGGTKEERLRNAGIVKRIYGIRSTLVHTGQLKDSAVTLDGTKLKLEHLLVLAEKLLCRLIREILRRGAIPNWQNFDLDLD